jgi:CubicO group peptidase (beta-lactamase class C family)
MAVSRRAVLAALSLPVLAFGRGGAYPAPDDQGGWPVGTPKRSGMLADLFRYVERSTRNGGLAIVHRGHLVYERYFGLGARQATPNLASVGKSVTSVAVGILLGERPDRFPQGLDQKISTPDFLPPEAFPLNDPRRAQIRLGQVLCITAGLSGSNPAFVYGKAVTLHPPGPDGWEAMRDAAALTVPMWCEPGAGYSYATTSAHLASIVLRTVSGLELSDFVRTRLGDPLGWSTWGFGHRNRPLSHTPGGGGICLRATDVLRLGYLLLRGGVWEGRQIIPPDFAHRCGRASPYNPHSPFSLQFHLNTAGHVPEAPRDAFWQSGSGGHCLYVIPALDLVVFKLGGRDEQYDPANTGLPAVPGRAPGAYRPPVAPDEAARETLRRVVAAFR